MSRWGPQCALVVLVASMASTSCDSVTAPPLPPPAIGYDAYRAWENWPRLRIGQRTRLLSTYDRTGGNDNADASHFIRIDDARRAVPLDVTGAGVLAFVRTNAWHGSPWHYIADGIDRTVRETSTATPDARVEGSTFEPSTAFPAPLALTWSTTQGADLSWVPIPFTRSLSLAYERTHFGTGYFIVHQFAQGEGPTATWDAGAPPRDVVELFGSAGTDIAPRGDGVQTAESALSLPPSRTIRVAALRGPAVVRALRFSVPKAEAVAFGRARIRITWDDAAVPAVDAPGALFFGAGTLYNRASAEWLVRAFPTSIHDDGANVTLSMFFPMPFARTASIELVGADGGDPISRIDAHVRSVALRDPAAWVGYFHATYTDHVAPIRGRDLTLLDTRYAETASATGEGMARCGTIVGTSIVFSDRSNLETLEGDPRFYFDDSDTPQVQGTGTEEWGGGGGYWSGHTTTLPFAGHPVGAPGPQAQRDAEDGIQSLYRFLLADAMPFGKNARLQLEHGVDNRSTEHYRSVAYWYARDGACLVKTDTLHVGDGGDEVGHRYVSPYASAPELLSSRYDGGPDHLDGIEIVPETTDVGRHTEGSSEFSMRIDPHNEGVLLRRKLDYAFVDQNADVDIAEDRDGAPFVNAGTWFVAGSTLSVHSSPAPELGPLEPALRTANRRWRDDEFLIPAARTRGQSSMRVRITFRNRAQPALYGGELGKSAWSEFRYTAYSWVPPR